MIAGVREVEARARPRFTKSTHRFSKVEPTGMPEMSPNMSLRPGRSSAGTGAGNERIIWTEKRGTHERCVLWKIGFTLNTISERYEVWARVE